MSFQERMNEFTIRKGSTIIINEFHLILSSTFKSHNDQISSKEKNHEVQDVTKSPKLFEDENI